MFILIVIEQVLIYLALALVCAHCTSLWLLL